MIYKIKITLEEDINKLKKLGVDIAYTAGFLDSSATLFTIGTDVKFSILNTCEYEEGLFPVFCEIIAEGELLYPELLDKLAKDNKSCLVKDIKIETLTITEYENIVKTVSEETFKLGCKDNQCIIHILTDDELNKLYRGDEM